MRRKINMKSAMVAFFAMSLLLVVGCIKENGSSHNENSAGSVFDFATRVNSTLAVKYDVPEGYQVYFEVYTQNPEEINADGQVVKKAIEPVDVGFTDDKGVYMHSLSIPSTVDQVYIYSPYAGVDRLLIAKINKGGVSVAQLPETAAITQLPYAGTRADTDYKKAVYNTIVNGKLNRIGYWINDTSGYLLNGINYRLFGRPDYVSADKITVSADILQLINQTLPEGGGVNSSLIKNGDIHVTERAHVSVHLIDEQTSANSTLAYYCYDTKNPPKNHTDVKDIIIAFPNSKVMKYHNYTPTGYNGALERGEGVELHYWKDGVDMGNEFPAGTSIGWIIYNESYAPANNGNALDAGKSGFYAAQNLNGDKRSHVALFRSGDKVIFGFEDWNGDYDYNDVVFYVKSDPIQAITPEIPEVEPEEPTDDVVVAKVTYRGIVAFEDCWPYRADFDLNDVVVKYESVVGYNKKNEVLRTEDKYTVMHSGAMMNNSFAYQLDVRRSEVEVTINSSLGGDGGAYVDNTLDRATVRLSNNLLDYANNVNKTVFEVQTKYTGRRISKNDFTRPPYNSFITTNTQDVEVHMTNMRPTERLKKELLGKGDDRSNPNRNLYYITYDEQNVQMPFAMDLVFESVEDMERFIIPQERMRIDVYYPGFLNWIKTNGQQDRDWYLKPKK